MMRRLHHAPLLIILSLAVVVPSAARGQDEDEEKFVVIKAARVITLAGEELIGAEIVLADGKVRLVGKDLDYPKSAEVIDARQEVVMPGMIHPRTRWQLDRYTRAGVHGDRSAAKEVYFQEIDFEALLEAGFTAVCFYPEGTSVPGPGAVYRTAGTKDQRDLGAGYLRITMTSTARDKKAFREAIKKARSEIEKVEKARKEWEEKQKKAKEEAAKKEQEESKQGEKPDEKKDEPAPDKNGEKKEGEDAEEKGEEKKPEQFTPPKIDPAVMPLVEWIRDKKGPPLLFELSEASGLRHLEQVLATASELPLKRLYLSGSYYPDYHQVTEDLGELEPIVLLEPRIGNLPYTVTRYNLAGELSLAGCKVAVLPTSDSPSALKELRVRLANLVRAGLSREDALKAVTLYPAQLLGLEDRLGSIEKGKDADLIFLDGDPLSPGTEVRRVMTFGEIVWEAP
jgi:hypothetical protein